MHSNFITPPDFVDEDLETITIINAELDEIESLARLCENTDPQYNIYLYRSEMNDREWLYKAMQLSKTVIIRSVDPSLDYICDDEKTIYYGDRILISRAPKILNLLHFFVNNLVESK